MVSTTETVLADKPKKSKKVEVETPKPTAPKCDHAAERARIGAGYLACPVCGEEIPNEIK